MPAVGLPYSKIYYFQIHIQIQIQLLSEIFHIMFNSLRNLLLKRISFRSYIKLENLFIFYLQNRIDILIREIRKSKSDKIVKSGFFSIQIQCRIAYLTLQCGLRRHRTIQGCQIDSFGAKFHKFSLGR